jgi:hypothetical protein
MLITRAMDIPLVLMQSVHDEENFEGGDGKIAIPFLHHDLRKARPYEILRGMHFHIVLREL